MRQNVGSKDLQRPLIRINLKECCIMASEDGSRPGCIRLPHEFSSISHVSVDVGGSLAKVVYFQKATNGSGGNIHFIRFETEPIEKCIGFISSLVDDALKQSVKLTVVATGGGAFKYYNQFKDHLSTLVVREDEIQCLVTGLEFLKAEIPQEVFTHSEDCPFQFVDKRHSYPYLVGLASKAILIASL